MNQSSKIGIGSVQFGLPYGISNSNGQTTLEEVSGILDCAYNQGVRIIDTASAYGTSEYVIGELHRNRFQLVSKFMPPTPDESIADLLHKSLENLQTDSLYGFLAHRPLELLHHHKDWFDLQVLKAENKIVKIGFSLNSPEEFYLLKAAGFMPDLVQIPYNYFDERFKEIALQLKAEGCEIHTRSVFLQGLFFLTAEQLSPFFEECKPQLQYLHQCYGEQLYGALLQYVLQQDFVDIVIMGVENEEQLKMNLSAVMNSPQLPPLGVSFSEKIVMPMYWPKS